jgi:von Willebrand factor type A domain
MHSGNAYQVRRFIQVIFSTYLLLINFLSIAKGEDKRFFENPSQGIDFILLLDSSGSMLLTDPEDLRKEGAKLFVNLLGPNDRLAIISFDKDANLKLSLTSKNQETEIFTTLDKLNSKGEYSDIYKGLDFTYHYLAKESENNRNKSVILISDGKLETESNLNNTSTENTNTKDKTLKKIIDKFNEQEITIFSLAFSDKADIKLLKNISEGTKGLSFYAPSPKEIHESYAKLLLASKRPQIIPNTEAKYFIDELVSEATFYVTKEKGSSVFFLTPENKKIDEFIQDQNIKWFNGSHFVIVTITEPKAGEWQVVGGDTQNGYVTVLTELKLFTSWPNTIYSSSPIPLIVELREGIKRLKLLGMNSLIDYAFQVTPSDEVAEPILEGKLNDVGENGDELAADGRFSSYLKLVKKGRYLLKVRAQSPTFEREQDIPFEVRKSIIELTFKDCPEKVKNIDSDGEHSKHSVSTDSIDKKNQQCFVADIIEPEDKKLKNIKVTLRVLEQLDKEPKIFKLEMKQVKKNLVFFLEKGELKRAGNYKLQAFFEAQSKEGLSSGGSELIEYSILKEKKKEEKHFTKVEEPHEKISSESESNEEITTPRGFSVFLSLGVVTVINFIFGAGIFMFTRSSVAKLEKTPEFSPLPNLDSYFKNIEQINALTEIDFNDEKYYPTNTYEYKESENKLSESSKSDENSTVFINKEVEQVDSQISEQNGDEEEDNQDEEISLT